MRRVWSTTRVRTTMSTVLLVPGAGGVAWYWHRVVAQLRAAGHDAVAVELSGADAAAGLPEYVELDETMRMDYMRLPWTARRAP